MSGVESHFKKKRAEYWQRYAAKKRAERELLPRPQPPSGNWRDVNSGSHAISDDGRVWSYKYSRLLRGVLSRDGYRKIAINRRGIFVHRLVAENFVPGTGEQVRHVDGDKLNNCASNLAWGTCRENIHDKWRHGKMVVGERHHNNRIPESDVQSIRESNDSNSMIAARYGVSRTAIYLIKKGINYGWL